MRPSPIRASQLQREDVVRVVVLDEAVGADRVEVEVGRHLGFGRTVVSEIEAPSLSVNLILSG